MAYFKTHPQNLFWETIRNHKEPQAMTGSCWAKNGIQDLLMWRTYVNNHMGHSVIWIGHFPLIQQCSAFLQNDWFSSHILKISQCVFFPPHWGYKCKMSLCVPWRHTEYSPKDRGMWSVLPANHFTPGRRSLWYPLNRMLVGPMADDGTLERKSPLHVAWT